MYVEDECMRMFVWRYAYDDVEDFLFLFLTRKARAHNLLKGILANGKEQNTRCEEEKQMWTEVLSMYEGSVQVSKEDKDTPLKVGIALII
jgi:hypothetical protein